MLMTIIAGIHMMDIRAMVTSTHSMLLWFMLPHHLPLFLLKVLQDISAFVIIASGPLLLHLLDLPFEFIGGVTLIEFIIFVKHFLLHHVVVQVLNGSRLHVGVEVHLTGDGLDVDLFLGEELGFWLWRLQCLIALVWALVVKEQAHVS
jgi:hypothetical protein